MILQLSNAILQGFLYCKGEWVEDFHLHKRRQITDKSYHKA